MAYVVNRLASQCPSPQLITSTWLINTSQNPGTAPTSAKISQGDTVALISKFNQNAARADAQAAYGSGGAVGKIWGLALSPISGLSLRVAQGQANILGLVEVTTNQSVVLPDDTSDIRIWLKQDGSIDYVVGSNVAPSFPSCFLGFVTTASGSIDTDIDISGVPSTVAGGGIQRQTADVATPSDTPNANIRLQTVTAQGSYHWDGSAHNQAVNSDQMAFTATGVSIDSGHFRPPYENLTLTGTYTLTTVSANDVRIVSTGSQIVKLPPDADANLGYHFRIFNDNLFIGPGHTTITVKDNAGAVTICTLDEKQYCEIIVQWDGSSVYWPSNAAAVDQM